MIDISVTGLIKSFDLEKKILDGITFQMLLVILAVSLFGFD